ncbi:MAG: fimbrillin family protein [Candidatus Cryptobacteroides sp.]|jgi:hypothetical protein
MKFKLYTFALLALLVASCERDIDIPEPEKSEGKIVTISATISPETRVAYTESTRALSWEAGDKLILAGYDDNDIYQGNYIFTYTGTGNQFSGKAVDGATKYKAYYNPANAITLDGSGNVQLAAGFWGQTQNGDNSTGHLKNGLLLFDETAKSITQNFSLSMKSSIIKWTLSNIPTDAGGGPKQIVWTAETATAGARSMVLNVTNVAPGTTSLTAFLAFDPEVMDITTGGKAMITLNVNNKLYQWSQTVAGGKDYNAGNRYTGTISGSWELMVNPLSYVARYNVNEAGNGFVTDETLCTDVGYFAWETAIANYHTANTITGYHLPSLKEWCSISPRYYNDGPVYVRFDWGESYNKIDEEVIVQGQTYHMTSDYRNTNTGSEDPAPAYALRYQEGVDNMRSAWRYEYIYDPDLARTHLKITSRNVAPHVNINQITNPTFWNNNKNNDVVRLFPAVGGISDPNYPTTVTDVGTAGAFLAFFTHQEGSGPIENLPVAWHFDNNSVGNWDPETTIQYKDFIGGVVFAVRLFANP